MANLWRVQLVLPSEGGLKYCTILCAPKGGVGKETILAVEAFAALSVEIHVQESSEWESMVKDSTSAEDRTLYRVPPSLDGVVDYIKVCYAVGVEARFLQHLVKVYAPSGSPSPAELVETEPAEVPPSVFKMSSSNKVSMGADVGTATSDVLSQKVLFDPTLVVTQVEITVPSAVDWVVLNGTLFNRPTQPRAATTYIIKWHTTPQHWFMHTASLMASAKVPCSLSIQLSCLQVGLKPS